ncbi:MAG: hypothetical protein J6C13_01050 [Clostridia bacterium]|nr:hypothetical protein [Clostridia bacterium]
MEKLTPDNPKVVEMSYNVFEKILTSIEYTTKEELLKLADIMVNKVQDEKYPEILKLAYADARRKIDILSLEQLNEIKTIITTD